MAFRATVHRSIDFSLQFPGILKKKIEVEELMRRDFGKQYKMILSPLDPKIETVEGEAISAPHAGDGKHPMSSKDKRLHSTFKVFAKDGQGARWFLKTVHIVHDEDEYQKALLNVKIQNQLTQEFAQESARMKKAWKEAQVAEEAKLAAEAEKSGGEQAEDAAVAPKA